jgi:hypothetical protein
MSYNFTRSARDLTQPIRRPPPVPLFRGFSCYFVVKFSDMPIPEFKNWFEVIEFEDYEGLTDEEMLELNDLQLEALEKVQAVNPAITDEMIREFKTHVNKFALASAREKQALKAEAIAKRNLDASLDNLLAHPDLPIGKSFPFIPKHKGN